MIQPYTIQITPEILTLIAGVDEFKGAWRALGTLTHSEKDAWHRGGDKTSTNDRQQSQHAQAALPGAGRARPS